MALHEDAGPFFLFGPIGIVLAMLPTGTPMGFVALIGMIALAGKIIRNAAILDMVPIAEQVFWGPMACAIIGGLLVAMLVTLTALPACLSLVIKDDAVPKA